MSVADAAKRVYESQLRQLLEAEHRDEYVAIEPESRSHFIGRTFLEAAMAAKRAYPNRRSFVLRIGHDAAFHIGASTKLPPAWKPGIVKGSERQRGGPKRFMLDRAALLGLGTAVRR